MFHPAELTYKNLKAKKQVKLALNCYATTDLSRFLPEQQN